MKKSLGILLLLSGCYSSPQEENEQLTTFRSCREMYEVGTREFDQCMNGREGHAKACSLQETKENMRFAGKHVIKETENEVDINRAPRRPYFKILK